MPENAFDYFLGRKNARIVDLLERNHDIANTFQSLLEHIVEHCDAKGLSFDRVRVRDATVGSDGVVRMVIDPQ